MERTMSIEEKIRRAEEIYERRHGDSKPITRVRVKEKKDLKLLKKMIIQIIICTSLYFCIYVINNNNYPFSQDFINKANEILSYDTNFKDIYENIKNQIINMINVNSNNNQQQEAIGGAEEEILNEEVIEQTQEEVNQQEEQITTEKISEVDKDIINIKNITTFIKPVEGTVSSKYGQRENATGSVPKNHTGTDIAANMGTKIKSSTNGEVVLASEEGDYGKHLKIQIGEVSIIYAHCNKLYVKQGDKVVQGQEIAEVGSTGNSTRSTFAF